MMTDWRRRKNRLAREVYMLPCDFAVTVTTAGRQRAFVDSRTVALCRDRLEEAAVTCGFSLLAFCFMPDHLHLLVRGSERSDLPWFMKRFKQRTSYEFKRVHGKALWQKSYYEHVVRNDADAEETTNYILQNQVRAGLVLDWSKYPFSGGAWVTARVSGDLKVAATGNAGAV
jgi:putative transposase